MSAVQLDMIRIHDANLLGAPCPPPKSSNPVQMKNATPPLLLPRVP